MKDVTFTVTGRRIRREALFFLVCFALANALNAYAIASRKTAWSELVTCLPFVLGLALVFYVVLALLRLVAAGVCRLFRKRS